jgi:hypothetical protein
MGAPVFPPLPLAGFGVDLLHPTPNAHKMATSAREQGRTKRWFAAID